MGLKDEHASEIQQGGLWNAQRVTSGQQGIAGYVLLEPYSALRVWIAINSDGLIEHPQIGALSWSGFLTCGCQNLPFIWSYIRTGAGQEAKYHYYQPLLFN